jgi:signal transduction histidine kinase
MEELEVRFGRLWKYAEIIVAGIVVFGLLIIQLPITPPPNKPVIYATAVFISLFTFGWHRLKLPISLTTQNFLESVVDLIAIAVVVHVTGGVRSYFNFLYFLPCIDMAVVSTKRQTFAFWLLTSALIFAEAGVSGLVQVHTFAQITASSYSLAILNSWAVGLVTVYSRLSAGEAAIAQGAATAAVVDKEKAINKLKDEFLFIISHELRGPITAIRGYLELLITGGAGAVEPSIKALAARAFRQGEHLNNLIGELLDISRLETGKLQLTKENFELNEFLASVLKEVEPDIKEKKIQLTFNPKKDKLTVSADKDRVREVTLHLLENAINFTSEFGKIWLWLESKDGKVYVSVADTGVGIPQEELPHLFERFHERSGEALGQGEGTDLGLFLAKELVEKMGGEISVESQVGKGSKFTFSLPLAKAS